MSLTSAREENRLRAWIDELNEMKAGFASLDVTPRPGSENPGGFLKRFLFDVNDPLHVKAAVFDHEGYRVAIVCIDSLSIKASTVRIGRELSMDLTGIPPANIMVAASHTHSGGPVVSWGGDQQKLISSSSDPMFVQKLLETCPSADPRYLHLVGERIGSAVALADKRKAEVRCTVGVGNEASVTFNRRFRMKGGGQITHPGKGNPETIGPAGPVDPDVGVLSVWDTNGGFMGCVVNFACHGTTWYPGGFSGDWPFYLDKTIRGVMGENSTVIFLNGACGDVTQVDNQSMRESEVGGKWAQRIGQRIGAEALRVIVDFDPGDLQPIRAVQKILEIQNRRVSPERLRRALTLLKTKTPEEDPNWVFARDIFLLNERSKFEQYTKCEIQAIQIGPLVLVSNPGELFCQLGLDIKSASPFPYTFVVELANGCIGYVPTEDAMSASGGGYETRMGMHSFLVPSAGRIITRECVGLIRTLSPGSIPRQLQAGKPGTPWDYGSVGPEEI